jgi:hypothetical protein
MLRSPSRLTLQDLYTGSHPLSTSFALKMVNEMHPETLENLQRNAAQTQNPQLHIRWRLWKPTGMNVIKYLKHITVYCEQTIKSIKIKCQQLYRYKLYKYFFLILMASYFCSSNYNRLVAVSYESLSFRKSFTTPFTVSLVYT